MKIKEIADLNKRKLILADLYSRPNYMNNKYKVGEIIGLTDLARAIDSDTFYLETLQVRANSADKMIAEAESQGKDTTNPGVMKELGKEINSLGEPLHLNESIMTAIFVTLQLMVYYGIAIGIWGLVFKNNVFSFVKYRVIFAFLFSLLFVGPVIAFQRTKQRIKDIVFAVGALWGNLAIVVGIVGLIVWVIMRIFLR